MTVIDRLRIKLEAWRDRPETWLVLGCLLILVVLSYCAARRPTPIPPKEQHTADSLTITQPTFRAHVDTLKQIDSTATRDARRLARSAALANQTADSLRVVALAAEERAEAAHESDSAATLWHASSDRYKAEADQRRVSYDSLHLAYVQDSTGHVAQKSRADATEARNVALVDFSARLQRDLARADPPCRVAYLLKCPSRTVVALVAVPLGVLAKIEVDRLTKRIP